MKRSLKKGMFLLLAGAAAMGTRAQTVIHLPPPVFPRQALSQPVPLKMGDGNASFQTPSFAPAEPHFLGGNEPRTPFFCKLEFLSLEATHVWFKIHAGDYDSYSRRRW